MKRLRRQCRDTQEPTHKKTHTKPEKSNNKMRAVIKERAAASCNPNDRSSNKSTAVCVPPRDDTSYNTAF